MHPIRGLSLFSRTSDPYCRSLASWHSPHSMTWRWGISFHRFKSDEWRVRPLWWSYCNNGGLQWGFRIPWVGMVSFQQQRPMWYRDLYHMKRDEVDALRNAPPPTPPRGVPFRPTIIDGGQSLH